MDYLELKRRRTVDIAERLAEKGYITATAHGRIVSPSAVNEFKTELYAKLGNAGELHHRDVARIFGLSRGAVRDLLALLVAEGVLIERGPTVVAMSGRGNEHESAT
jgi:predicted transcriptional regulator of viral defense system